MTNTNTNEYFEDPFNSSRTYGNFIIQASIDTTNDLINNDPDVDKLLAYLYNNYNTITRVYNAGNISNNVNDSYKLFSYKPTLEEFHVGFEYNYLNDKNEVEELIFDFDQVELIKDLNRISVKYLTESSVTESMQELKDEVTSIPKFTISKVNNIVTYYFNDNQSIWFNTTFNNKGILVWLQYEDEGDISKNSPIHCKNKSEFKRVVKQFLRT